MCFRALVFCGVLVVGLASGCDNTFEPTARDGPAFSIFGIIETAADTQWIRVSPLRTALLATADPTGVTVTLQDTGTGQILVLRDSALAYVNMIGAEGVYAHNFWTAQRVRLGATYRLRVEGKDGAVAEAVIPIPRDFEPEVWVQQPTFSTAPSIRPIYLHLAGLTHLPFAFWKVEYYNDCTGSGLVEYTDRNPPLTGDTAAPMYWKLSDNVFGNRVPACANSPPHLTRFDVELVGSAIAWPSGNDLLVWKPEPEKNVSNVTGGLGFIAAVIRKETRVEDCALPYPSPPGTYCKLRYDSAAATLRGTIASSCTIPLDSVVIRLRELDPPAPELARTRFGIVDRRLGYDIGALRPGIRHELRITAGQLYFSPFTDTLTFVAGRTTEHTATVKPRDACPK